MFSGIRARLMLAAAIPLTIAVVAAGGLLLVQNVRQIELHHMESAMSLARQAAILAELPLATSSKSGARSVADFVERSADFVGMALVDRSGGTIESRGNVGAASLRMIEGAPVNLIAESDARLIYVVHPVTLAEAPNVDAPGGSLNATAQRVGYAAITFSRLQERNSVGRLLGTGLLILGVTLALSLLLARSVANSVSKPIVALSSALSDVAREDFDVRLTSSGVGEMARVAENFNAMVATLAAARRGSNEKVRLATEALARRTAEAEAANLAKSQYLAAASHDLRQPAHALSLYISAAKRIVSRLPADQVSQLEKVLIGMESSAQSQDALLNSILDISRIDAGVLRSNPEPLAVAHLFERVVQEHADVARPADVILRYRATSLGVYADPVHFDRICQNLVANALKFAARGTVLLSARKRGDQVLIQVWDQGGGIAPEHIGKVFEEFYQVAPAMTVRARGMGLGLSIVRRLCRIEGGSIAVRSVLGRGTVFSVLLPSTSSPQRFQRQSAADRARIPVGTVALVIDDEAMVREATQLVLAEAGYQVIVAENLIELSAKLNVDIARRVAAAVVDFRLADGYSGIEAARYLQARFGDQIKIVIVTGDTSPERLQTLHQSDFQILHKPINDHQLLNALTHVQSGV